MKEQDRNQRIAKTRARVEHIFGGMGQMGAQVLKTIGLGHQTPAQVREAHRAEPAIAA